MKQGEEIIYDDEASKHPPKQKSLEYIFRHIPTGIKFLSFTENKNAFEFELLSFYGEEEKLILGFENKKGIVYLKIDYKDIFCQDKVIINE